MCDGFHVFRKGKDDQEKKLVSLLGVKHRDGIYICDDEEYETSPVFDAILQLLREECDKEQ